MAREFFKLKENGTNVACSCEAGHSEPGGRINQVGEILKADAVFPPH